MTDDDDQVWRKSFIDPDRGANLSDAGLPGFTAAVLIANDGRHDFVLIDSALLDGGQRFSVQQRR